MKKILMRIIIFALITICLFSMLAILRDPGVKEKIKDTQFYSLAAAAKQEIKRLYGSIKETIAEGKEDGEDMIGGKGSGIINILLIGQDRRPGEESGRSDSMILCTIRPKDKTLVLTSFLRDLYVKIPGHGSNRINAAFRFGGKDLLKDTLKENFHMHVDGTVQVDFNQFSTVVDAIGGITMELRADEASEINRTLGTDLQEGSQLLNGDMALAYSRIRKLDADGDFSRTDRQRKVLSAILKEVKQADLKQLKALGHQILPYVDTDISYFQALRIGTKVLPMLKSLEVTSQKIPGDGEYQGRMIDGMAVLVPDLHKTEKRLRDTLLP